MDMLLMKLLSLYIFLNLILLFLYLFLIFFLLFSNPLTAPICRPHPTIIKYNQNLIFLRNKPNILITFHNLGEAKQLGDIVFITEGGQTVSNAGTSLALLEMAEEAFCGCFVVPDGETVTVYGGLDGQIGVV